MAVASDSTLTQVGFVDDFCSHYEELLVANFAKRKFAVAAYHGETGEKLVENLSKNWNAKKPEIESRWKQMLELDLSCMEVQVPTFDPAQQLKSYTELYGTAGADVFEAEWPKSVDVLLEYTEPLPLDAAFTRRFAHNWKQCRDQVLRLWESALSLLDSSADSSGQPELPRNGVSGDSPGCWGSPAEDTIALNLHEDTFADTSQNEEFSTENTHTSPESCRNKSAGFRASENQKLDDIQVGVGKQLYRRIDSDTETDSINLHGHFHSVRSPNLGPSDSFGLPRGGKSDPIETVDQHIPHSLKLTEVENSFLSGIHAGDADKTNRSRSPNIEVFKPVPVRLVEHSKLVTATAPMHRSASPQCLPCVANPVEGIVSFKTPTNSRPSTPQRPHSPYRASTPVNITGSRDDPTLPQTPAMKSSKNKLSPKAKMESLVSRPRTKTVTPPSKLENPPNTRNAASAAKKGTSHKTGVSPHVPVMESPVPLLVTDKKGKWQVCPEAATLLNTITAHVAVVAVVGKYRTGKSYLMNLLAGRRSGFSLGATIQSETKGIWMWVRPHPYSADQCLLLLDTEGLYDVEKGDDTHDMQLFTFAVLLSNCLVFNTVGSIDSAFVEELQLVSELTSNIKVKSSTKAREECGDHFAAYFPNLFVVLRDFFLELKKDGKEITTDEYLENSLKLKKGMTSKAQRYNAPRECIRNFFHNRRCFALPKPVRDDLLLRKLETVPDAELVPEFMRKSKVAVETIARQAVPLTVDTYPVTGTGFLHLVSEYADAINKGGVPCIESAVDAMAERECRRAYEEALQAYNQAMEQRLQGHMPVSLETLREVHEKSQAAAVNVYRKSPMFDQAGTFLSKLEDAIESQLQSFSAQNSEHSRRKSEEVFNNCFKKFEKNLKFGIFGKPGGHAQFLNEQNKAVEEFKAQVGLGPMRDVVLSERLTRYETAEHTIIRVDKALGEKVKEEAKLKQQLSAQQEQQRQAERETEELRLKVRAQQQEHARMLEQLQWDCDEQLAKHISEHDELIRRKESEYQGLLEDGLQRQATEHQQLIARLKQERLEREQEGEKIRTELDEYKQEVARLEEQRGRQEREHKLERDQWLVKIESAKKADTTEQKRLQKQRQEAEKKHQRDLEKLQKQCRQAKQRVKQHKRGLCVVM